MKPTGKPFWISSLQSRLKSLQNNAPSERISILGIGQELRGDDAAGIEFVRALLPMAAGHAAIQVLECGPTPESFSGKVRRHAPGLVIFVDAAQMDLDAGEVRLLSMSEVEGFNASTHSASLGLLAGYLEAELGCQTALLAIQPAGNDFDTPLSEAVWKAVVGCVAIIADTLFG